MTGINRPPLVIRADGNARMGTGHVMRMLALAQAYRRRGGRVVFLAADIPDALVRVLEGHQVAVNRVPAAPGSEDDARLAARQAAEEEAGWVVLDGYHFGPDYQAWLQSRGFKVLVMDDMAHLPSYHGHIIVNQNLHAPLCRYPVNNGTRLLLGPDYVLLREEFRRRRAQRRAVGLEARRVLVTMGGGDSGNFTATVIRALKKSRLALEITAVVGPANPHRSALQALANGTGTRIITSPPSMADLMAWADLAISAGGSTVWELAFMGLPALLVTTAGNQAGIVDACARTGMAVNLGDPARLDEEDILQVVEQLIRSPVMRRRMAAAGAQLVDGGGCDRIIDAMSAGNGQ